MLLSMLIACPAERLGVELPKGGPGAISMDDLQRDVYALTRPEADPGEVFARRLAQMHLEVERTEDRVCARSGEGSPRVLVARWSREPPDAAQAAVLVSVAKAWDGEPPPSRETWLCLRKDGAALPAGEAGPPLPVVEADVIEAIDYRALRDVTRAYAERL